MADAKAIEALMDSSSGELSSGSALQEAIPPCSINLRHVST